MELIKEFLSTSTIHGMSWISGTRRYVRLFWILVVAIGFSGAGYLIHASFYNWKESPISTIIETLPISQITFPNVPVCPPRNSFLNLNYDIEEADNIQLLNDAGKQLLEHALNVIQDVFYNELMMNLSKVEDPDRYYNWYHGHTWITYPHHDVENNQLYFTF